MSRPRSDVARSRSSDGPALLVVTLPLALAAFRPLAALVPGSWLWGLAFVRPLPVLWMVLPPVTLALAARNDAGSALAAHLGRLARAAARHRAAAGALAAALAGALAWVLEDRTRFLGDFELREGVVGPGRDLARLFPQAMPLDLLVHVRLPEALARMAHVEAATVQRSLGACCAALAALAAIEIARALRSRGANAVAVAAAAWSGGGLLLFTGYGKGLAELTALALAAVACALRAASDRRALVPLAIVTALAMGFHRAGALWLPLAAVALLHSPGTWRDRSRVLALVILAAATAFLGPRIADLLLHFDRPTHLVASSEAHPAGLWICDLANALLVLVPLAPLIPVLLPALRRSDGPERAVLLAAMIPAAALLFLVRPRQGVFRDLDVLAPAAAMLAAALAAGIARFLEERPDRSRLVPAVTLGAVFPALLWMLLMHRPAEARSFIETFAAGPPRRSAAESAAVWDYLGTRALEERRADDAARAYARSAASAPSPRLLYQWGSAEFMRGRLARADSLFRESLKRDSSYVPAWRGVASTSSWSGDTLVCARAERYLELLDPGAPELPAIRAFLARARGAR